MTRVDRNLNLSRFLGLLGAGSSPEIESIVEGTLRSSLGDARRTRRRVTPRASTAQHRDAMRLNETRPLMRCDASRASRLNLKKRASRIFFAPRSRIARGSSRARSGRGRDERHRNETKKNKKKLFFYAGHNAESHRAGSSTSNAGLIPRDHSRDCDI